MDISADVLGPSYSRPALARIGDLVLHTYGRPLFRVAAQRVHGVGLDTDREGGGDLRARRE